MIDLSNGTVEELIVAALAEPDDDRYDLIVGELQGRGDQRTFSAATALCRDADPEHRQLGVHVLSQLGYRVSSYPHQRPYWEPTVDILLDLLAEERDADVLASIAFAFGHLNAARAIEPLAGLRHHPDPEVRHGVAFGVCCLDDDAALEVLIELSADPDRPVRDWATFGLAQQTEVDQPRVREALLARLDDADDEVRGEAIVGLALRGDERVATALVDAFLDAWPCTAFCRLEDAVCAFAVKTGDPRLREHVETCREEWMEEHPGEPLSEEIQAALDRYAPSQPEQQNWSAHGATCADSGDRG